MFGQTDVPCLLAMLGAFGLRGNAVLQPLPSLSGGQRVRVAFAALAASEPHVLVLDEPTNHLDIYSIDALTEALKKFKGGVVLITHNQSVLAEVAEEIYVVVKSKKMLKKHPGTVEQYLKNFE